MKFLNWEKDHFSEKKILKKNLKNKILKKNSEKQIGHKNSDFFLPKMFYLTTTDLTEVQ